MDAITAASLPRRLRSNDGDDWRTLHHEPGYCAMRGICGNRVDGDVLNCPANVQAPPPDDELAERLQACDPSCSAL